MFIVNFVHHMDALHPFWKHNDNYVTFADWIMPGFIFAVGFSYRLTILKRLEKYGPMATYLTYVKRSLALILVSLMMYGWGGEFKTWESFTETETIQVTNDDGELEDAEVNATYQFFAQLVKSNLWEVLSIIGVAQIFIMPVIARSSLVRFLAMLGCMVGHFLISWWFNWGFVHGYVQNFMVQLWGTGGNRSWDGGFFGIMSWSVAMLAGSLIYDILVTNSRGNAAGKTFLFASVFMISGYVLSCGTRFYDVPLDPKERPISAEEEKVRALAKEGKALPGNVPAKPGDIAKYAFNPMIPDFSQAKDRSWSDLLAEPPFVMPPHYDQQKYNDAEERLEEMTPQFEEAKAAWESRGQELEAKDPEELTEEEQTELEELKTPYEKLKKEHQRLTAMLLGSPHYDIARQWNYWMMYKRMVSVPFILFATGFAIAIYALFIVISDMFGMQVGVFRTFGLNPLAAYVLHSMIGHSLEAFTPGNAPWLYCWFITFVFMGTTYLFVRHLEKHNIFIRL